MNFQKAIVIIAIIILIIMLLSINVTKSNTCVNTKKLGTGCTSINFDTPKYKGPSGKIEKCKWAKNCGVVWDGITDSKLC